MTDSERFSTQCPVRQALLGDAFAPRVSWLARRFPALAARALTIAIAAGGLAGCGEGNMADLRAYSNRVLARKGTRIEELPPVPPYELATFTGEKDPFAPFYETQEVEVKSGTQASAPDANAPVSREIRGIQELENFSLDSLRMIGTLELQDTIWGIVRGPDGIIHRVREGDFMGRNYGRITEINEIQILLAEKFKNTQGRWQDREATLALVE